MDRRNFIAGSSALVLASTLSAADAKAFWWLIRLFGRGALGRHMMRFGRAGGRLRYAGRYGGGSQFLGRTGRKARRRKRAREILAASRNIRMLKNIGELVYDNSGNGFPSVLNGNVSVIGGGKDSEVYCASFPSLHGSGTDKPVIMEIAEIQMLDVVGQNFPDIYRRQFPSTNEAVDDKKILSCLHPVSHIKDGEFDDEWNHITPLIYKTSCGNVIMDLMEETGKCIIEWDDTSKPSLEIPVRWQSVNIRTGQRHA